MAEVAGLYVKLSVEAAQALKDLDNFSQKLNDTGRAMQLIGAGMTLALTTPLVMAGKAMFNSAADFDESINKVDVAFKDSSDAVKDWSENTLKQFGIAQGTALEMVSLFGDMGTTMGLVPAEAADMSTGLVGLAGDLASFKNVQLDVAQTALAGIFTGETESLKRLGIIMTEANLEQYALEQGSKKLYGEMTQAEKVQLRYAYVTDMSKNAIGDFSRTSDSSANVTRTFSESIKEMSTSFGQALLPIITPVIQKATELVQWFGSLDGSTQTIIITAGLFLAALGPIVTILGTLMTVVGTVTAVISGMTLALSGGALAAGASTAATIAYNVVQGIMAVASSVSAAAVWVLNGALAVLTSPITWVIVAIVALIAIGVLLWKNWDTIVVKAGELFNGIVKWFSNIWSSMKDIGGKIVDGLWSGIKGGWDWLTNSVKNLTDGLIKGIKGFLGIHSPSKVFAGIGENISAGLALGISDAQNLAVDATIGLGEMTVRSYPTGDENARSGGFVQNLTINAPTQLSPSEIGKQATKASRTLALGLV